MDFTKNIILTIFNLLLFAVSVQSQDMAIDSLKIALQNHKEKDTTRVNLLNELAYSFHKIDTTKTMGYLRESENIIASLKFKKGFAQSQYIKGLMYIAQSEEDSGLRYLNSAKALYNELENEKGIADCFNRIGHLYKNDGNIQLALSNFQKSLEIRQELGNHIDITTSLVNIGNTFMDINDHENANIQYKKALEINTKENNKKGISDCLNNIGNIYGEQGNYPLALDFYRRSSAIDEDLKDTLSLSKTLNNIGIIYKNTKNYDKAIANYKKVLRLQKYNGDKKTTTEVLNNLGLAYKYNGELDLAENVLSQALTQSKEIQNKMYTAVCLNNTADVLIAQKEHNKAKLFFEEAKTINVALDFKLGLTVSYLGLAKVLAYQKKYDDALSYALKSVKLAEEHKLLNYQKEAEQVLWEVYQKKGNDKEALKSHLRFKALNDSIFNIQNIEKMTQLEYEYKYKRALDSANIRELKLTKEVSTVNSYLEKSQRDIFLTIIALLLTALILGGVIFFLKWRNIKEKNQNVLIEQKLLRSQMTPHFIFNSLSVLQGMILNKEEEKSISYLSKFSKLLRLVLENSRDKIVPLIQELDAIDNYMVLQNLDADPPYAYDLVVEENIDINQFQIPPMLLQPFIENALEHAFVSKKDNREIAIHLKFENKQLICSITDNGIGIDAMTKKTLGNKKSLATTITAERLAMLAKDFNTTGAITVEDRKKYNERGTQVTLVIPYKIKEDV